MEKARCPTGVFDRSLNYNQLTAAAATSNENEVHNQSRC